MILLKKLQLHNFLSHENTTIDFSENEKALIDGASGAGKSSIFDAILWVLYGQGRADNRSLVRKGAKKGFVCLELTRRIDQTGAEDTVIITRSATGAGKHTLEVAIGQPDGTRAAYPLSGVRELQAWIDKDLIGASYLLFINSVAYVQGNTESFVAQTAPKRKELLLEIVKAEDYQKHYEKARQKLSELGNEESTLLGSLQARESLLGPLKARVAGKDAHIKAIEDNKKLIKDVEPLIMILEAKKASTTSALQTIDVLKKVLNGLGSDINTASVSLSTKKEKVAKKPGMEKSLADLATTKAEYDQKLDGLRGTLAVASENEAKRNAHYAKKPTVRDRNFDMMRHETQITFLEKKEVCPAGEQCPYHSKTLEAIKHEEEEIKKLAEITIAEAKELGEWTAGETLLPAATDIRTLVKDVADLEKASNGCGATIVTLTYDLKTMDETIAEIATLQATIDEKTASHTETQKKLDDVLGQVDPKDVADTDNALSELKSRLLGYNDIISKASATLESIDQDEKSVADIENMISMTRERDLPSVQDKARKVGLVKDAFGSKGIETLVIDYLLPKLEDRINAVLGKLSDFRVRLDTQAKTADGESLKEGLFITILNELNEEMPFEAYSGGEKLKISVAISEALATMQRVGFRLFDETFIGLDENSTESFAEVLDGLQKNFSQVLVISHLLQIKELFDKKIVIAKNNNISYVKP